MDPAPYWVNLKVPQRLWRLSSTINALTFSLYILEFSFYMIDARCVTNLLHRVAEYEVLGNTSDPGQNFRLAVGLKYCIGTLGQVPSTDRYFEPAVLWDCYNVVTWKLTWVPPFINSMSSIYKWIYFWKLWFTYLSYVFVSLEFIFENSSRLCIDRIHVKDMKNTNIKCSLFHLLRISHCYTNHYCEPNNSV